MIRRVRPFVEQGHYIAVHEILFDEVMPHLSGSAWKILSLIIRKTIGWHKEEDAISYTQIAEGTGITNRNAIRRALMELQGYVPVMDGRKVIQWLEVDTMPKLIKCAKGERHSDNTCDPNSYSLNLEFELLGSM